MRRLFLFLLAIVLGAPVLYLAVAFGLAFATPRLAPTASDGIAIYACDNGVHTDLVLPVKAGVVDWRAELPEAVPRGASEQDYVSVGWGSRDFYINTPTWNDVRIGTALKAVLWDETVVHVENRGRPSAAESCGVWVVDPDAYQRIVAYVVDSFQRPAGPVAPGYGPQDIFYAANGRYTIIDTCNQWTGQALRAGGAPVAPWTPFSFLVTWNLPTNSIVSAK
jgi:uncharacterized protein (TIGR02117 family)